MHSFFVFFTTLFIFFTFTHSIHAQSQLPGDANNDGLVNGLDYVVWLSHFNQSLTGPANGDFNVSGRVDGLDYVIWLNNFGHITPTSTPTSAAPTPTPIPSTGEWTQFGNNAQHTNYTSQSVTTPWRFKWSWNGAGVDGKTQAEHLSVPDLVQPITGGNRVYMIAANSVYALDKTTGNILWTKTSIGTLNATPVYENEIIYVPSSTGVYKINASNGATITAYTQTTSTLALTLTGNTIFAVTPTGSLQAIDKNSMTKLWEYVGGSVGSTPASYYGGNGTIPPLLIYVTQDLNVHAVNASNGTVYWKKKPTNRAYQSGTPNSAGAQAEKGWPVIASQHGIVFIRYRLDWDSLWIANPYPNTNADIRTLLSSDVNRQALFALNLANGTQSFIPAVGNGGAGDGGTLPMGTQPVIRMINGKEVAYVIWRNGLTCATQGWCDGREDAAMGEMVLDSTTVPGYVSGDMRFVRFIDIQTDEMMNITMANDVLFHSHWLINAAEKITDRSDAKGATFANPITTTDAPFLIWRQCNNANTCSYPGCTGNTTCGINCAPTASRYCSQGLYSYGDARSYPPGFYEYNNDMNYGSTPFTVVSGGLVLIKTDDGAVIALESGNPTAQTQTQQTIARMSINSSVLGTSNEIPEIMEDMAMDYADKPVRMTGTVQTSVDHRPKAVYLWMGKEEQSTLVRIFAKDMDIFPYDPMSLKGKTITVTGKVTLYWPEGRLPEIIVTDPKQIVIQ